MFYYIIDLSIRTHNDETRNTLTFVNEGDFEESLNYNLDVAIENGDYTIEEANEVVNKFNDNDNIELEVNGFMYGKASSKDEVVEAYKEDYDFVADEDIEVEDCDTVKDEANPKNVILVKIDGEWKTWGGTNRDKLEEDSRYEELVKKYGKENIKLEPNKVKDSDEEAELQLNIKEWYTKEFPTDEVGETLNDDKTFRDLFNTLDNYEDVYELLGGDADSVVRERCFKKLAEIIGESYDYVYNQWLNAA